MLPDDPNKAIEDGLKADGEFLRDVDKGHSATETGLGVDLGAVLREEHSETIDSLQAVSDAETPPETPPLAPDVPQIQAEHAETIDQMQEVADSDTPVTPEVAMPPPALPSQPAVVNVPQVQAEHDETISQLGAISEETAPEQPEPASAPPRPARPSVPEIQHEHSEAIVQMGKVVHRERTPDERPTPVTVDPAELERLTFPGEQHQSEVKGAMENWIREQREWMAAVSDLFRLSAELHRQDRLELELIRGQLERIRL